MCAPYAFVFVKLIEFTNELSTWLSAATLIAQSILFKYFRYFLLCIISLLMNLSFLFFKSLLKNFLLPAYVNLSNAYILALGKFSDICSHMCEPIKPAAPVIKNDFIDIF